MKFENKVKVVMASNNIELPVESTPFAAGRDVRAYIQSHEASCITSVEEVMPLSAAAEMDSMYLANQGDSATMRSAIIIKAGRRALIKSGLRVELPKYTRLSVRPRSGLALKFGITVLNTPGTIDEDYRGDCGVILINHGSNDIVIPNGARIAQLILEPCLPFNWEIVDELSDSVRGEGGFNSTGSK